MYSKSLLIMVQDLNGKEKQDLQLVILTKFFLCILEEQEKNYISHNHSIKCSEIRFMCKKDPKYVTTSVFLLGICVQNVIWFSGIPVYHTLSFSYTRTREQLNDTSMCVFEEQWQRQASVNFPYMSNFYDSK